MSWNMAYPTYTHRARLTLVIATPTGVKTGSSVFENTTITYPSWITLGNNSQETDVRGEAVYVDLGNGKNLVALMAHGEFAGNPNFSNFTFEVFRKILGPRKSPRDVAEALSHATVSADLHGAQVPTLVTFPDLKNPYSAHIVAPDALAWVFGPGFRLVQVHLELTEDPVTSKLETELPFLKSFERANGPTRRGHAGQFRIHPIYLRREQ